MSQGPSNNFARRIAALSPEQRELLRQRLKQEEVGAPRVPRLPRAEGRNSFVLSFAQQRLWFLEHLEPDTAAYNLPLVVLLTGELDAGALARALGELARRHESLRTSFALEGEAPAQVVEPEVELPLPVTDLSATPEPEREAEVKRLVREEATRPFDLSRAPLVRIGLLRLGQREHVALLTMHHIISDAWSMGVLIREIAELYQAFAEGRPSPLAPLPIQYADFAAWQRGWLRGEVLERQLDYWRGQLAGAPAALELPTDRPRPAVQTTRGAREEVLLPAELSSRVRALTQRAGATLFVTLLAAFQALLSRHSRQDDVAVGTSVAGRSRAELEGLIGYFINTLVLRARLGPGDNSAALLERVRRTVFDAQQHQDLPFEKLVDELQPERSMTRTPLFQVMFIMLPKLDVTQGDVTLPGLKMKAAGGDSGTSKFDLTLTMVDSEPGITGTLEYNTDLFDAATVRRLLGHYGRLLEGMTEDPARPLASIPLLGEAERRQLLVGWNRTETAAPESSRVHELFERQARLKPSAVAAVGSGRRLTYGELDARSNQLARCLRRMGVGPESLVGVCLGRSPELLVALLGVLKAGGAYVPLDAQFPTERLAFMLSDAAPRVLLTEAALAGRVAEVLGGAAGAPAVLKVDEEWDAIAAEGDGPVEARAERENLAYVIYTSGSTGRPKGVQVSHGAVVNFITSMSVRPGVSAADVLLAVTTLSFDIAGLELYLPLAVGGRVVLASGEEAGDGAELLRLIEEHGVTVMQATPSTWRLMLGAGWEGTRGLKVLCGGEALPLALSDQLLERSAALWNMYGPTETTIWSTTNRIESAGGPVHIGSPIANTQVYLLDDRGEPVPLGVAGEVYIGGDGLARGYLGRPSLTAERFLPDPFSRAPGSRLYRAGDLARYDSAGRLHFLGRSDQQVKLRGFRIELGEVEAALLRHPRVRAAAAAVRPGPTGEPRLVAFVVHGPDDTGGGSNGDGIVGGNGDNGSGHSVGGHNGAGGISAGELRRFVQGALPEYMVPAHVEAVASLPLTPNGKVDRRALPELSGAAAAAGAREYVAPRTEAERRLAGVWAEVLGAGRVGAEDNFFELGGDSILTLQVVARARREGVGVTARQVFQHQRLADLAAVATVLSDGEGEAEEHVSYQPFSLVEVGEEELSRLSASHPSLEDLYPLSPLQHGLLFHSLSAPSEGLYFNQLACRLSGPLDPAAFSRAWRTVLRRHPALRACFAWEGLSRPLQVVHSDPPLEVACEDWSAVGEGERERRWEELLREERRQGFDVGRAPLMRLRLVAEGEGGHRFLWCYHHALLDGWSAAVVIKEALAAYAAESAGAGAELGAVRPYGEYLGWLAGKDASEAEGYWRRRLASLPEAARGVKKSAGAGHSGEGEGEAGGARYGEVVTHLGAGRTASLRALARSSGLTLGTVVTGAWALVLSRSARSRRVVFGVTTSGRPEGLAGAERMVGLFINTLPAVVEVEEEAGAIEWLRRLQDEAAEWREYEHTPLWEVAGWAGARGASLFETLMVYENYPEVGDSAKGGAGALGVGGVETAERTNYGLTLVASEGGGELVIRAAYDGQGYEENDARRLLGRVERVLGWLAEAGAEAARGAAVADVEWIPDEELRQVLHDWPVDRREFPRDSCMHELFEEQVRLRPDAVAVAFRDERLTFSELNRRANQFARSLRRMGVGPESLVGLCVERSAEMVVALLAILKAGGAYVPLDAQYPAERIAFMLEDAGVRVLITQRRMLERLPADRARLLTIDDEWAAEAAAESGDDLPPAAGPGNLAYVTYTSGSTGRPKGALITHRNVVRLAKGIDYVDFRPDETFLQFTPVTFDVTTFEVWGALLNGARLAVMTPQPPTMEELGRALRRHGVTTLWLTSGLFHQMVDERLEDLRGLRQMLAGGDVVSVAHARKFLEVTEGGVLVNGYGPTECTTFACCRTVRPGERLGDSVPLGPPIANTDAYVLDERMRPLPVGVAGELYLGGEGLARGYHNRPGLTAERFVPHPFSDEPGARLYRTGDLVRWAEGGDVEFLGRADDQVKVRGFRVETGEVETTLRDHERVRDAAVLARPDGSGGKRLVAYVVGQDGAPPAAEELRAYLRKRLPEYMVPALFMPLDEMPLTQIGKIDRKALPAPGQAPARPAADFRGPRTPVEEVLAQVWAQALGGARGGADDNFRVGVDDNFFDLGGHSLIAMQVISRVRQVLGVELGLDRFFAAETLSALASAVEEARVAAEGPAPPPLAPAPRGRPLPLSFAQRRMWFVEQVEAGQTLYNLPVAARLRGRLDLPALSRSLNELLARHEILRTRFVASDGEPAQVADAPARLPLAVVDLSGLGEAVREAERGRLAADESRRPFDLSAGPLLRATLLRLGEAEHVLLLTTHHIAGDAWSMSILLGDLAAIYEAFVEGRPSPLAPLPVQYADYAAWQRGWLRGDALEAHLAYWRRRFGGTLPTLELPADRPRPEEPTYGGASRSAQISPDLARSLRELGRREGATLFMTLLAAFQTLLHRYTGQEDVIVGSSISTRPRVELERLVGCFINTLGLRTDLSGDPTFSELLGRVREVTLGAYAHQDLPFEQVVEAVRPERALKRAPLFRAWFTMLNTPPARARQLPGLELGVVEGDNSAAQFDLTLIVWEAGDALQASLTYSTDLFEEATGARVLDHLLRLLESAAANPRARLSALEYLSEGEKVQRTAEQREKDEGKRRRLTSLKPKPVSLSRESLVATKDLTPGRPLPLVVEPAAETDLARWAAGSPDFIAAALRERGGILFRGFSLPAAEDFRRFVTATMPDLLEYRERSTPRTEVGDHIYTSTEYPPDQPIALHNEFSYARSWPMKICFFCEADGMEGGETPIADSRRVFRLLDPRLRERFAERKVMYVRNYGSGIDLTWQTAFQTEDRREVEEYCRRAPIEFEWKEGDVLKTWQVRDAVARHPHTGEEVWFNQAHLFHISNLDQDVRRSLSSAFGREDLPRNAYYGDGSPIEDSALEEVRAAYREAEVVFRWRKGDVLLLDNMLVAHGRRPYRGTRKILVGMAEPHSLDAAGAQGAPGRG